MDDLLKAELDEIKARIAKAAKAEAAVLLAQFGERIKHLQERLGEPPEDPAPPPPAS